MVSNAISNLQLNVLFIDTCGSFIYDRLKEILIGNMENLSLKVSVEVTICYVRCSYGNRKFIIGVYVDYSCVQILILSLLCVLLKR